MHTLRALFLVALSAVPGVATAQTVAVSGANRTVDITATDRVIAIADIGTVHIGFIAYGPDKDAAYAAGSRTSNAIVKALTEAGIPADTIESENQAITPIQPYEQGQLSPEEKANRRFQVRQSWTVRTSADAAARVLDTAVKAGANLAGQIDWSLRDENAADAEAAGKALQHARANAAQMAQSLNAKLGTLLYASNEVQASPVRPVNGRASLGVMLEEDEAPPPLAINPRRIERSATVHAVFALD